MRLVKVRCRRFESAYIFNKKQSLYGQLETTSGFLKYPYQGAKFQIKNDYFVHLLCYPVA